MINLMVFIASSTVAGKKDAAQLWLNGRLLVAASNLCDQNLVRSIISLFKHEALCTVGVVILSGGPLATRLKGFEYEGVEDDLDT